MRKAFVVTSLIVFCSLFLSLSCGSGGAEENSPAEQEEGVDPVDQQESYQEEPVPSQQIEDEKQEESGSQAPSDGENIEVE